MNYGLVPRVGAGGSFLGKAREFMGGAVSARSAMQPRQTTEITPPGKTAGGALSAGMGGAVGGAGLATMTGAAAATGTTAATAGALGLGLGAWTGIGAAVMGLAYFLS